MSSPRPATVRHLDNSGILYVFVSAASLSEAVDTVLDAVGPFATYADSGTAAAGATRVTIDPRLIAAV